ncbi:Glutamate--cysteine ligase catalytic subunit [Halotydeus destructor]|nr:Glutamate--cysteine ligase catalytic subunit [Halotydeus destructor]
MPLELSHCEALDWAEIKDVAEHIKQRAVEQFVALYHKHKGRQDSPFKWGDETEYVVVKLDSSTHVAQLSLRTDEILKVLKTDHNRERDVEWQTECGSFMLEGVPGHPYGQLAKDDKDLLAEVGAVEANMALRRQQVEALLEADEFLFTLSTFPRLGCPGSTSPDLEVDSDFSLFTPRGLIYSAHDRYIALATNMQKRLGRRVHTNVPVFRDVNTADPSLDPVIVGNDEARAAAKPYHVYMDSMMSGFGCCGLQVTVQAANLDQARHLYDHLTPLCPILMALSAAASPINRGYLIDYDTRWSTLCQAVDDRLEGEVYKTRFGSNEIYLSNAGQAYNDVDVFYHEGCFNKMVNEGVDPILAKDVANMLLRGPLSIFREELDQMGDDVTVHFTNLLSDHWPMVRFKPPLCDSIGWRVEFRPMEVQLTDFENAAYVVFLRLLSRLIVTNRLNTLIPFSKVDENMTTSLQRDAVRQSKFWFKCDVTETSLNSSTPTEKTYRAMTINDIINGDSQFKGLIPLIDTYLDETGLDGQSRSRIDTYLKLISDRASGKVLTTAQRIRQFVLDHHDYKGDSVVSDRINYDLMVLINKLIKGQQ